MSNVDGPDSSPDSDSPAAIATPVEVSKEVEERDEETKETFSEGGLKPSAGVPWIKVTHMEKVSIQCPVDPGK